MLTECINDALCQGLFRDSLKFANITPVHKKDEATDKENCMPVSKLFLFSKIFEKVIYDQLKHYLEKYLNSLLFSFWRVYFSQLPLFKLLQVWKN